MFVSSLLRPLHMLLVFFLYNSNLILSKSIGRSYTRITDKDNSKLYIKRLPNIPTQTGSCYEMRKEKHRHSTKFCYPALLIAGVAKSGTSAMYEFLKHQDGIHVGHPTYKEYCLGTTTYYKYLSQFPHKPALHGEFYINGCVFTSMNAELHALLQPQSIYILMVRDLADRMWAAYNFWCNPVVDSNCTDTWVHRGMYRSPSDFHETLMKANSDLSVMNFKWNCSWLDHVYTDAIETMYNVTLQQPLVVASELLMKHDNQHSIYRIQEYINQNLHVNCNLDRKYLHYFNTGGAVGPGAVAGELSSGLYNISNYKPLLSKTREYIYSCWKTCADISTAAQYNYTCKH